MKESSMKKGRLEAFSDGVLAIIITIMVLELKTPHGTEISDLLPLLPVLMSYILSFIYVGIYWSNHHHLFHATEKVNGGILWANLHLLFWLSLTPFVTAWAGENHFAALPTALYGVVLCACGVAYYILGQTMIANDGENSALARALGKDFKGKISVLIYAVAVGLAFVSSYISFALYILVAILWIVPDRRIEGKI